MNKICYLNSNKKHIDRCNSFLIGFDINVLNDNLETNLNGHVNISKSNKLKTDYCRLLYIYLNGGLLLDGKIEIIERLNNFFENDAFIGFKDENTISTNIIWTKEKNNEYIKKILDEIESDKNGKYENINQVFSKVFERDFDSIYSSLVNLEDRLYIYPYDYFYPLDYEKRGKSFSENLKTILYEDNPLNFKEKLKLFTLKKVGIPGYRYLSGVVKIYRHRFATKKYELQQKLGLVKERKYAGNEISSILKTIEEYSNENKEYVIIHNPNWLGVTSATKELFENFLPIEELYSKKIIDIIAKKIADSNIKQVIFSSFADGWDKLATQIKEQNSNIKIKCFWHGSNSQVIEPINWRTNLSVINLHKKGIIDVFATCKESILYFYKSQGYTTHFIKNTVRLDYKVLGEISDIKIKQESNNVEKNKLKIGIYAAYVNWRKNMFNQIAACSLIDNSEINSTPLNFEGQVFGSRIGTKIVGEKKNISRDNMLKQMAQNDINLYVTFSECAPMIPIESMEVGTICITGNNHHYFKNTELEKYLVVNREDDVIAIKEKIEYALENKEEIFKIYKKWKEEYDKESIKSVKEFLKL